MYILITPRFLRFFAGKWVHAMALYPFILVKDSTIKMDISVINHEKIHLRQQLEMLIIPFYILYGSFYLYYRILGQNHFNAYMSIPFEKEAYSNETDLSYLRKRKFWDWISYINKV